MSSSRRREMIPVDEESGEMDMSPMIDMVFLLLMFFLVNATAITVKPDQKIKMPIAEHAGEMKSANGAIVVNVYENEVDGAKWSDDTGNPLKDKASLDKYFKDMTTRFKHYEKDPGWTLYLRGDKDSVYKNSKEVIAAAAAAGIPKIMFATHIK